MSRKITDLAITFQPIALEFIHRCQEKRIEVLVYCTYRSPADQDMLYSLGRTAPGLIVTNAKGGQSKHNLSVAGKPAALAFDAVPVINGKAIWSTSKENMKTWLQMGIIATELGIVWGGHWKGKKQDFPHFEMK